MGAAVEDGSYQGETLRNLMTLDTSCRRDFKKLVKEVALLQSLNGKLISHLMQFITTLLVLLQ